MNFKKFETRLPSAQTAVDIFKDHWASDLSGVIPGVEAGKLPTFDARDPRPALAAQYLGHNGSLAGMRILELGPLEGGHTYQLEKLGSSHVEAIEANAEAYLKCLITKELLSMKATFLFGNFIEYLEQLDGSNDNRYDMVFCSGVLYHMTDPLKLLQLISRVTKRCFIWTHYHREGLAGWAPRQMERNGMKATYWVHSYGETTGSGKFWGGVESTASWLGREDILKALQHFGFDQIQVLYEYQEESAGPHFSISAQKSR